MNWLTADVAGHTGEHPVCVLFDFNGRIAARSNRDKLKRLDALWMK
jgi:hypothetical protein